MMRFFVGDLATGRKIIPLPASSGAWSITRNRAGSLSVDLTLSSDAHRKLDLRQNAAIGRSFLAATEGERVVAAGPIWDHVYDDDTKRLTLESEGMWSLLMRRFILPAAVESTSLLVTAGDDAGKPNPAVATNFVGKTWPEIVEGILEQGFARTGGTLPITFGAAGTGSHDKSYDAASFKTQGEALLDLTELADGPEIEFRPFFTSSGTAVEWRAVVGDDANPQIFSVGNAHTFNFSVPKRTVRGLKVRSSARDLASEAWGTGGRQAAVPLISAARSSVLTSNGYPRMETVSSAHSTVELQSTLDGYTTAELSLASMPREWWEWETNIDKTPSLSSLWLGDRVVAIVRDNAYLPDGMHPRRIAAMSGSLRSRWVKIVTDEVPAW